MPKRTDIKKIFIINSGPIVISQAREALSVPLPTEKPYTEEELRKLLRLAKAPGKKTFASAKAFRKHARSLSGM